MKRHYHTSIGGEWKSFQTTQWSVIERIAANGETDGQMLINDLLGKYWKPVYCYLRHKGHGNEEAKDLTQGFFQEVVLGRKLVHQAKRAKGSFRKFLLTALERYVKSAHRKDIAQKRIPKSNMASLEYIDANQMVEPLSGLTAEESFHYAWVLPTFCFNKHREGLATLLSCQLFDNIGRFVYFFRRRVTGPETLTHKLIRWPKL